MPHEVTTGPLTIVGLRAENVKRLKAVHITPTGNVVQITGANGAGKSSVLDAIAWTLGGQKLIEAVPVREGEQEAKVEVDLGQLVVRRWWSPGGKSYLEVAAPNGAAFKSPQAILDKLVGKLTFDPLEFSRMASAAQRDVLLDLLGIGAKLAELDALRQGHYGERTVENRRLSDFQGAVRQIPDVPEGTPDAPLSVGTLAGDAAQAQRVHEQWRLKRSRLAELAKEFGTRDEDLKSRLTYSDTLEKEAEQLRQKMVDIRASVHTEQAQVNQAAGENAAAIAQHDAAAANLPDVEECLRAVAKAEETNACVATKNRRAACQRERDESQAKADALTQQINDVAVRKTTLLREAEWPIAGLGFDEQGVTWNARPLHQASDSEKLRISLAIAMILNPELRVMLVRDGSLLDSRSLALVEEMTRKAGFQLWIEQVDESGKVGIVIEDGSVVSPLEDGSPAPTAEPAPSG